MATVVHAQPVVVRHPESDQFVTLARGMEFDDVDPIVAAFAWAFVDSDIEDASAAPGKRRYVRRAPAGDAAPADSE